MILEGSYPGRAILVKGSTRVKLCNIVSTTVKWKTNFLINIDPQTNLVYVRTVYKVI